MIGFKFDALVKCPNTKLASDSSEAFSRKIKTSTKLS